MPIEAAVDSKQLDTQKRTLRPIHERLLSLRYPEDFTQSDLLACSSFPAIRRELLQDSTVLQLTSAKVDNLVTAFVECKNSVEDLLGGKEFRLRRSATWDAMDLAAVAIFFMGPRWNIGGALRTFVRMVYQVSRDSEIRSLQDDIESARHAPSSKTEGDPYGYSLVNAYVKAISGRVVSLNKEVERVLETTRTLHRLSSDILTRPFPSTCEVQRSRMETIAHNSEVLIEGATALSKHGRLLMRELAEKARSYPQVASRDHLRLVDLYRELHHDISSVNLACGNIFGAKVGMPLVPRLMSLTGRKVALLQRSLPASEERKLRVPKNRGEIRHGVPAHPCGVEQLRRVFRLQEVVSLMSSMVTATDEVAATPHTKVIPTSEIRLNSLAESFLLAIRGEVTAVELSEKRRFLMAGLSIRRELVQWPESLRVEALRSIHSCLGDIHSAQVLNQAVRALSEDEYIKGQLVVMARHQYRNVIPTKARRHQIVLREWRKKSLDQVDEIAGRLAAIHGEFSKLPFEPAIIGSLLAAHPSLLQAQLKEIAPIVIALIEEHAAIEHLRQRDSGCTKLPIPIVLGYQDLSSVKILEETQKHTHSIAQKMKKLTSPPEQVGGSKQSELAAQLRAEYDTLVHRLKNDSLCRRIDPRELCCTIAAFLKSQQPFIGERYTPQRNIRANTRALFGEDPTNFTESILLLANNGVVGKLSYKGYGEVLSLRPTPKQITHPVLQEAYSFFMKMLEVEWRDVVVGVVKAGK